MPSTYDAIVVGAGHNGLAAAAYLARSGKQVLVLERRPVVGGSAATDEFAPGFRTSVCWASADRLHPEVIRDLELESHGLRTSVGGDTVLLRSEGGPLRVSAQDPASSLPGGGDDLREFQSVHSRITRALESAFSEPLPDPEPEGLGDIIDLLTLGWRLRRLGREEMPQALRMLPMALRDVLEERLDDPGVRALVALPALGTTWLGPYSPGGYLALLVRRPAWADGLLRPPTFAVGGMGAVSEAIADAARSHGAEIRTDAEVASIDVEDGRAVAVTLAGGETIPARCVVSSLDPQRTLLELGSAPALAPDEARKVANIRNRGTAAFIHLGLSDLPRFDGLDDEAALSGRIQIGDTPVAIEQAFDCVKYGELPDKPALQITLPSLADPGLAPDGHHVMHVRVDYVPDRLAESDWASAKEELADRVVSRISEHAHGFAGTVMERAVITPADIESQLGINGGCLHHVELALDSMVYMRPVPGGWGHTTPVHGLYLSGPGTHPGGGVTGVPGKLAARQVLTDWKGLTAKRG